MATYLVKYDNGNGISAESFKSRNDAIDYLNEVNQIGSKIISEISDLGGDKYKVVFENQDSIILTVAKCISTVKYDLRVTKNGHNLETRRFSSRDLAIRFAHNILEAGGTSSDFDEDILGLWVRHNFSTGEEIRLELSLVTVVSQNSDYDLLGVKKGAPIDEVKKEYQKLAFKLHPDRGGDAGEFSKVNDAYNRIISGKVKEHGQKVTNRFRSINYREYIRNKTLNPKAKQMPSFTGNPYLNEAVNNSALTNEARSQATGLFVRGIVEFFAGILLSMSTYIFYGLIVVGFINGLRGLYYMVFPKELVVKALSKK